MAKLIKSGVQIWHSPAGIGPMQAQHSAHAMLGLYKRHTMQAQAQSV
jgi:hypothetical protein